MNSDIERKFQELDKVLADAPRFCGPVVLNWIGERFRARNWMGDSTENWPQRKDPTKWGKVKNPNRALLVGHNGAGRLKNSFVVERATEDGILIGSDVGYARAHNEGFKGTVSQRVRAHTRTRRGKDEKVKAHDRTIHQNLPRRQFIGNSQHLAAAMIEEIWSRCNKIK